MTHERKIFGMIFEFSNTTAPSKYKVLSHGIVFMLNTHTKNELMIFFLFRWRTANLNYLTINRQNNKKIPIRFGVCISYRLIVGFKAVQSFLK